MDESDSISLSDSSDDQNDFGIHPDILNYNPDGSNN